MDSPMIQVELLTVIDCFLIEGRGLIILPDFSLPKGWKNRDEQTKIIKPSGEELELTAKFQSTHFSYAAPNTPLDQRWRVIVLLPGKTKEEMPIGSRLIVSSELKDMLVPSIA